MLKDEGYKLMGAAFEVYNELGYGMAEEVYQQSVEIELGLRSIPHRTKHELAMFFKGQRLETRYVPDLFVYEAIVVELKAVSELVSEHEAQLFNYMRIARQPVGYLINFGRPGELQWKRFLLSDLKNQTDEEGGKGTLIFANEGNTVQNHPLESWTHERIGLQVIRSRQ